MAETIDVKLDYPVEHKGKTIEVLTFRRRKARDLLGFEPERMATATIALTAAAVAAAVLFAGGWRARGAR